ncbi:hypothetical protein KQI65_00345 [bacterium]|nr:hypothetical protein [bacterium]
MSKIDYTSLINYLHTGIQESEILVLIITDRALLSYLRTNEDAREALLRSLEWTTVLTIDCSANDGDNEGIASVLATASWVKLQPRCGAHVVWTACGPLADYLLNADSVTGYDERSPLSRAAGREASLVLIGDDSAAALIPWFEEEAEVPHRFWKKYEVGGEDSECAGRAVGFRFELLEGKRVKFSMEALAGIAGDSWSLRNLAGLSVAVGPLAGLRENVHSVLAATPDYFLEKPDEDSASADHPILRLDHIGIVSKYEMKIRKLLGLLGARIAYEGVVEAIGVNCQYHVYENVDVEIVSPIRENSIVSAHQQKLPFNPIHHIAFEVRSLEEGVAYFRDLGYHPIDGRVLLAPKPYHRVVFLSPVQTGGLLIELVADEGKDFQVYGGEKEDTWTL